MLDGVRIVEFEGLGPAPFAAMLLADLGAEVIVIHRPEANPVPGLGERNLIDRGKRAITLDLKLPADVATARTLVGTADGLIEGFRPGVMERLGLGPADCHAIRPALVYGRMTGWGQTGPMAQMAGHDLNYLATSGALWYASPPGVPPFPPPTLLGDIGGGALYLVIGMLAGLLRARATGTGTVVDAAIVDGAAHMMALLMSIRAAGGCVTPRGQSLLDGPHWSRCYATADGRHVSVQCLEPKFYATFLQRLGLEADERLAAQFDPAQWPAQAAILVAIFSARPLAHWRAVFAGTDACVAPVLSPDEAALDPHMAARGSWRHAGGDLQPGPAPRFDPPLAWEPRPAPARNADDAALRTELRAREDGLGQLS